jgi:hypothetical protein
MRISFLSITVGNGLLGLWLKGEKFAQIAFFFGGWAIGVVCMRLFISPSHVAANAYYSLTFMPAFSRNDIFGLLLHNLRDQLNLFGSRSSIDNQNIAFKDGFGK